MPLRDHMHILSVDDHLIEHPRVWKDRLPSRHRNAGPKIVETPEGHHVWEFEGNRFPQIGLNAVAGKEPKDFGMDPIRYDDMIPGCYDPAARVQDMDVDGVQAACCFPSFPGFGGGTFARAADKELGALCVSAWNDFNLDEWYAPYPHRFIPLALVPFWHPVAAAAEIRRVAERGARGITFPENPLPLGLPSFHTDFWEPVWDACEETDLPVSLHFGSGGFVPSFGMLGAERGAPAEPAAPFAIAIALFATNQMWTVVDLLFSGVLQRHPMLKFVLAEGGIGWIPYVLERSDYTWERHRWYQPIDFDTRPSDLFRRSFWGCMISDEFGVANRHAIGIDRITVEVDYPHSDSNWPNTRKVMAEQFADVPDDEVHRMVEINVRELYRFPRSA
ncbi:MAG: amidohydrolase family protein [Acidimicrobiales bacterium]